MVNKKDELALQWLRDDIIEGNNQRKEIISQFAKVNVHLEFISGEVLKLKEVQLIHSEKIDKLERFKNIVETKAVVDKKIKYTLITLFKNIKGLAVINAYDMK